MNVQFAWLLVILLCAAQNAASAPSTQDEFWPEVDAYVSLDSNTRLDFVSRFDNHQNGGAWRGDFGGYLDVALKPVFRRELRQSDDVFNKRFLSCRGGFRYISSLGNGSPYLEHRWAVECTPRYELPGHFILSDRSTGEIRFVSRKTFAPRYRNRLQLERDFNIGKFVYTPYLYDEVFYDTRYDVWNRNRYSIGIQIPAGSHFVVDTYYFRQNQSRATPAHTNVAGLRLQFYY